MGDDFFDITAPSARSYCWREMGNTRRVDEMEIVDAADNEADGME